MTTVKNGSLEAPLRNTCKSKVGAVVKALASNVPQVQILALTP